MRLLTLSLAFASLLAADAYALDKPKWSYDGDKNGQEEWGKIDSSYDICTTGTRQSPVSIGYTEQTDGAALQFNYQQAAVTMGFRDHTLVIDVPEGSSLTEGSQTYKLKQIRFHSPSEHTVKERFYPMEIQLMHENDRGRALILSVFADSNEAGNAALQQIAQKLPTAPTSQQMSATVNLADLLPAKHSHYSYIGSLTIPPCTEGVQWRVLKLPINVSNDELQHFAAVLSRNARTPQPLYMRTVKEIR